MNISKSSELASKIFEAELELDSNCTMQILTKLVDFYRNAIEYFEEIKSPKVWDYQERLQKILMRPSVLELMQEENVKHRSEQRGNTRRRAHTHTVASMPAAVLKSEPVLEITPIVQVAPKKMHKALTVDELQVEKTSDSEVMELVSFKPIPYSTPESPKHEKLANRMVETQQKRTENVILKAVTELKAQDWSLKDRLAGRKQRGLNLTMDTSFNNKATSLVHSPVNSSKNFFFEPEKSAGMNVFATLHQKIEKIMEASFLEKTEKITEIKVRYGTQISELESEGGIYTEIVKEMKRNMSKEIETASQNVDFKRKEMICEAKRELGLVGK